MYYVGLNVEPIESNIEPCIEKREGERESIEQRMAREMSVCTS